MADLTRTVSIIFSGEDKASGVAGSLAKNLEGIGDGAGGAVAKVDELDRELDGLEKKAPGIAGVGEALKALAASLVVKDFIDANLAFEKFQQSMVATTGDAAKARAEFEYVREVSNRLGIETRSTAEAYAKFAASVKGTSLEGEGARVIFEGFAGTMSRVGSSSADINDAFVQLAQGISKGRFELEDLKSIAERVPGFFNAFAKSLGVTTPALFELISAGKIGSTEIAKFADTLKANLDGATFEGYAQSFSRLRNAIDDTYLILGEAGAWDVLIKGLQLSTAAIVGSVASFRLLGEVIGALAAKAANPLSFDLGAAIDESINKAANTTRGVSDALLGVESSAKAAGGAGAAAGDKISDGMAKGAVSGDALKKALNEVDKNLKALGIDPKTFADPVKELEGAFKDLATNAASSGSQIVTGLIGALSKLPQDANLDEFRRQVAYAFRDGRITADEYAQALALIDTKQKNLSPSFGPVSEAARKQAEELEKTAKASKKAAEEADKYRLEMEKLASNERIKAIEAKVTLNVAQLEADTKRVQAAFDSIDNTVNSTGKTLEGLFALFGNDKLSFSDLSDIRDQIDLENKRRDDALKLQKDLTRAQIDNIRAQTQQIERGDAMIKVDGAGLQPHLEAFMWEILKTIQVRVNQDGLKMLLGV